MILMVSHDLHMVMASTKQVVCLYHHICRSGAPQAVTKDPEFEKLFGQDMAAMMAPVIISMTRIMIITIIMIIFVIITARMAKDKRNVCGIANV